MRIHLLSIGAVILLLAAVTMPFTAHAQSARNTVFTPIDAEGQIAACKEKSRDLLMGSNADIREGHLDISLCLKDAIVAAYGQMFSSNDFLRNDGARFQYDIEKEMEDLRTAYSQLMWRLYNENNGCPCGTLNYSLHNSLTATLFADILRKMADEQKRHPPKTPR